MLTSTNTTDTTRARHDHFAPMSLDEWQGICRQIVNQPLWRSNADKEADYADGNQLHSDLLRRQAAIGIPPAKENIIAPV